MNRPGGATSLRAPTGGLGLGRNHYSQVGLPLGRLSTAQYPIVAATNPVETRPGDIACGGAITGQLVSYGFSIASVVRNSQLRDRALGDDNPLTTLALSPQWMQDGGGLSLSGRW